MAGSNLVTRLVAARLRFAWRRWLTVVASLSLGIALPVVAQGVSLATTDTALERAISDLPAVDRILTVATFRQPGEVMPDGLDDRAREGLSALGATDPLRLMMFRPLTDQQGGEMQLTAADGLAATVKLVDGRLPESCEPTRCEVVQLVDSPPPAALDDTLGLVIVGSVARTDPVLLAGAFEPVPQAAVLIADGVDRLDQLAALANYGRSYGWVAPVSLAVVRAVGIDQWVGTSLSTANRLLEAPYQLGLTAPDDVMAREVARARTSAGRFRTLGGATAVLMLGAAIVGGAALRRDHDGFVGALRRRGMSGRRMVATILGEVGAVTIVGVIGGAIVGSAVTAVIARRAGLPVAEAIRASLRTSRSPTAALALVACALVILTLTARAAPGVSASAWRVVDGTIVAGAVFLAVLVARGGLGVRRGATSVDDDPLVPLLPMLVLVTASLLLARAWPWIARAAAALTPRSRLGPRLGFTGAAGRPLRPVATTALVAAAIGATVFAVSYRATLQRGALDQAAESVPLDLVIGTGRSLDRALDLATPAEIAAAGVTAYPVLRTAGSARVDAATGETVQIIGVDPAMLPEMERWSATVGGRDPAIVGGELATPNLAQGTPLPAGGVVSLDTTGPPIRLAVTAYIRAIDGRMRSVPLRVEPPSGTNEGQRLVGELPDLRDAAGAPALTTLVALHAAEPSDVATMRLHNLIESDLDRETPTGVIGLGAVHVDDALVAGPWRQWGGVTADETGERAEFSFVLTGGVAIASGRFAGPGASTANPVPVIVDRSTGTVGELVTLTLNGESVSGRVIEVVDRFPTARGKFAVMDRRALERLIDVSAPGAGQAGELWVRLAHPEQRLDSTVFRRLAVRSRGDIQRRLETDPVATSASGLLLAGSLTSLLMAMFGLIVLVVTERHDDAAQVAAWEADGVPPSALRASLWWRAAIVAIPAAPVGFLAGSALSRLTARLIAVTATAAEPRPPLVAGTGLWWGIGATLAGSVAALLVAAVIAWRSLREPMPSRVTGGVA